MSVACIRDIQSKYVKLSGHAANIVTIQLCKWLQGVGIGGDVPPPPMRSTEALANFMSEDCKSFF